MTSADSTPKKKVLLLITKSNWGGAQRYVFDVATNLPKDQFDVTVAFGQEGPLKDKLDAAHIRTIPIMGLQRDVNPLLDLKVLFTLISLFKKEKPDVVHLNSSKIGGVGAFAARIAGVPRIIFTGHGWAFNENRSWISKKIIKILHWLTILFSHTTIAVSQKTADDVRSLPFLKKKIKVVYNGIAPFTPFTKEIAREKLLPHQKSTQWIGTIAELHPTKGLTYVISAMKTIIQKFPQAIFVVIGAGELKNQLEKEIQTAELTSHVFLVGSFPEAKLYIPAFDVFILPSISEALAYTVIEAGFAKVPVIASHVGGLPEIIAEPNQGILVPARDVTKIIESIEMILSNPEKNQYFIENLYSRVADVFTLDAMIQNTIKTYTDCE